MDITQLILQFHKLVEFKVRHKQLTIPNFIGVGAGRCGTSSIYRYLKLHPQIYVSPIKEVNYFGIRDKETTPTGLTFSEYTNYFLGAEKDHVIGEISPVYLTNKSSLKNLYKYIPDAKILVTVRNPIERFISQYKHHALHHKYTSLNEYTAVAIKEFDSGGENFKQWFAPQKNLQQSKFMSGLKSIEELFKHVLIIHFEQLIKNPNYELGRICEFLEINYLNSNLTRANASKPMNIDLDKDLLKKLSAILSEEIGFCSMSG